MKTTIKISKDHPSFPLLQKIKAEKQKALDNIRSGKFSEIKKRAEKLN